MNCRTILLVSAGCLLTTGCDVRYASMSYSDEPSVDTYLALPSSVEAALAPHVDGYATPALSRYDDFVLSNYGPDNLPCFVVGDFNGDGYDDYAFLFSQVNRGADCWETTTKLEVVTTCRDGSDLILDYTLGTVTGDASTPVSEYWAIRLAPRGYHEVHTYYAGGETVDKLYLDNDAICLKTVASDAEEIYYVSSGEAYQMAWDAGGLGKRHAVPVSQRAPSKIILSKKPAAASATPAPQN